MMLSFAIVGFVVCCVLVIWLLTRDSADNAPSTFSSSVDLGSLPGKLLSSLAKTNLQSKIIFNGREYSSSQDMPPEVRKVYEQVLADENRDGIPDLFQGKPTNFVQTNVLAGLHNDPTESLQKLKELNDAGLITDQEFETKKAEILSRM